MVDPLLTLAEVPDADRILHELDFSLLPLADERYVVVASRGQFDEEAVEQGLLTQASYIALLANRKRRRRFCWVSGRNLTRQKSWLLFALRLG